MTSLKFRIKQEKTVYYTTNKTNLFSPYDAQRSKKENSGRFLRHPLYHYVHVYSGVTIIAVTRCGN